ncbi:MAG: hypothetical protein ABI721_00735 [Candidatus Dojkabacteria bacterium]
MAETRGTPKSIFGMAKIEAPIDFVYPNYTKDKRSIQFFRDKVATSEEKAITLTDEEYNLYVDRYYRKLECIKETKEGKFWLDEETLKHGQDIFKTFLTLRYAMLILTGCFLCGFGFLVLMVALLGIKVP